MNFRIAVKAFTVHSGRLLLIKRRSTDVHKPGAWDIPGGRLEPAEDPFLGLCREALEEAGMAVRAVAPLDIHHFTRDDGQAITMIIFLCEPEGSPEVKLSEEHTEHVWHDLRRPDGELPTWLQPAAERYRKFFQPPA